MREKRCRPVALMLEEGVMNQGMQFQNLGKAKKQILPESL